MFLNFLSFTYSCYSTKSVLLYITVYIMLPYQASLLQKGCLYNLHLQSPLLRQLHGISPSHPSSPAQTMSLSLLLQHQSSPLHLCLPGEQHLEGFVEPPLLPRSLQHGMTPQLPMDRMDPGPYTQPWGIPSRLAYLQQPEALCLMDSRTPVLLHRFHLEQPPKTLQRWTVMLLLTWIL